MSVVESSLRSGTTFRTLGPVRRIPLVLALGGLLVLGGAASGGTTRSWSRVTDTGARNIDQVGLARTNDGVLHVVWGRRVGQEETIRHAAIAKNGGVGAATNAVPGVRGLSDPDLVVMPDGSLRLFYGVVIPSPGGIRMSLAGPSGTGWTGGGKVSSDNTGGDPGATTDKGGTPIFAWTSGLNSYYKIGTNAAEKDGYLGPGPKCCFYDMEAAVDDATGAAFVAYHSNVTDGRGLFVRQVRPSLGAPQLAPGSLSGGSLLAPDHRMPLVARDGGGVFFAYCGGYPRCLHVFLWRVGGKRLSVATGRDIEDVNLARGPGGRLWLMWQDSGRLRAARTNPAATKAGAVVNVPSPPGTSSLWDVFGEGSLGPLDLLAHVSARGGLATWHRQVLPGLRLSCVPKKTGATCLVTDAGQPLAGATVKIGGTSVKTLNSGVASFTLKKGTHKASATKAGYTPAKSTVKVR
jgi:hypothetical protein